MTELNKKLLQHIVEFEKALENEANTNPSNHWDTSYYIEFMRADTRFRFAAKNFEYPYPKAPPTGDQQDQMTSIVKRFHEHVEAWRTRVLVSQMEADVSLEYAEISGEFSEAISFDNSHKTNIDGIIGKLRHEIKKAEWLTEERQQRILRAVNTVQTEVDKELSNFHLILGKLTDLGDALGNAGKKAKPAFDRIEQLSNAIRGQRKQSLSIEKQDDPLQIEDKSDEDAP